MSDAKEKRKHSDAVVPAIQKKAREVDGTAVTDAEVDEFCGILRRINAAAKYFKSGGDEVGPEGTRSEGRWRASLEKEIMLEVKGATKSGREEEHVHQNLGLDLNASPQPE